MAINLQILVSKFAKYRGQPKEPVTEVASSTGIAAARLIYIEAGHPSSTLFCVTHCI